MNELVSTSSSRLKETELPIEKTQVVIVGAGPVGSVAAYRLAQMGIDVILIEANEGCAEDLRASTLHPPTLEMMKELGVVEELEAQGLRAPVFQYMNRQSKETFSFDMSEISDLTEFPYRLQCEQFKLSRVLTSRLESESPGSVRFRRRLLAFEQDETGVTVHVEAPIEVETIRANYLIGCDGANSIVRKWLKIGFEGFTYPEKFVTFSTKEPLENYFESLENVNYVADPEEWMVLLRVLSLWRVLIPARGLDDKFIVSDEMKEKLFGTLIGDPSVKTEHRTIYNVHQRVANKFFEGRVILAGDAAHLNNPLGGFGMNSGVHDVWNLSEKLVRILKKGEDASKLLSLYERKRQAVTRSFVQHQSIKNKNQLDSQDKAVQKASEAEMRAILGDAERRREYLLKQAMFKSLELEAQTN